MKRTPRGHFLGEKYPLQTVIFNSRQRHSQHADVPLSETCSLAYFD